ncbi:DUF4157 domain-containing protein [Methylobacter sp. BBA5.1]|uniref:eCIS core domain-containing protein n=1 Tax=Methylobacter sp. BBA5.1 TaxID=1495064 RepID=UPI00056A2B38|nr:DUF4157 domain-containing protein [Methylobacter sp. BBA5.1]
MKASSEKSSTTASKTATQTANRPFFAKAGGGDFFAPASPSFAASVQTKMTVNKPGDKFEQEADKMADKVMRMPDPALAPIKEEKLQRQPEDKLQKQEEEKIQKAALPEEKIQKAAAPEEKLQKKEEEKLQKAALPEEKIQKAELPEEKLQKKEEEKIQKAPAEEEKLQRKGDAGTPAASSNIQSAIQNKTSGGQPLSSDVRGYMEPRFNADFSNVRIHSDPESASLNQQLSARAFTYQNHVFFSQDQYQPGTSEGKQLLAHELTHTIQQGHAVQRSPQVNATTSPPAVQRFLGIDIPSWQDVLDWLAEKAYNIPGYRMFTIVIGVNPINGESVDRSAANILRAIVEFLPGGKIITDALEKYNVFEKAGSWVEGQLKRFANLLGTVKSAVDQFMDDIDFLDVVLHPVRTWNRAVDIFTKPVNDIIDFIGSIFQAILQFIRDAVLMPLAALAQGKPGFDLLCAILGKNPITNEPVPRNADTLIGGFMKLIGQEEIWENIKKGNAVQKAWQWFNTALQELFAMVVQFPQDFITMLKSLEVMDFIILPNLFIKVFKVFGNFVVRFTSWAFGTTLSLLEIIFSVVAPGVMPYIAKAKASFQKIIRNPIAFVGNLVKAGKMGFTLFMTNIGKHLKTALIKWITGPLGEAGVYIPKSFALMEIVRLVLSVLGLTWQAIRGKLVKIIPDPILAGLEKTAGILVTLVKDGPAAAWEQIKAELNELKGQLIAQVTQMVATEIVKAAITKLVMMINPAGAFVQAVLAIWNTITFFIQKIRQIGAAVAAFVDSISAIAAGQVAGAAKKVEMTMARTLTVVIAFLAKFAGLGSIPEKIVGIVRKIRQPIDKGLDKIVAWLGNMLKKAGGFLADKAQSLLEWWKNKVSFSDKKGQSHKLFFSGQSENARLKVASVEMFTEEFVARIEQILAQPEEALARSFALPYLSRAKQKKQEIDKVKIQIEREKKTNSPSVKFTEQKLKNLMNEMAVNMAPLFDVLPENRADDLPAEASPGKFVTLPYKGTERKAEILFASKERVNYEVQSLSSKMQLKTVDFKKRWAAGEIRPYVEGGSREKYLGDTPGKASSTGRAVIARYKTSVNENNEVLVQLKDGRWWPLSDCDMSHDPIDAVDFWNNTARKNGWVPKGPEIRAWMLNPANYILEPSSENRSRGSRHKQKYLAP